MAELIDRQAAIDTIHCDITVTGRQNAELVDRIKALPTVDAVPVGAYKQVRWERDIAIGQLRELGYELGERVTHRGKLTNREWVDFLVKQFDISRTSAKEMLHGMMQIKKEDNFKKEFNHWKS